jgi:aminopeptidase N
VTGFTTRPTAGASISGDSYLPAHGNGDYHVVHYDLELDYRINADRLTGQVRISATAGKWLSRFSLDFGEFRIGRITVNNRAPARFTHRAGKLHVWPARPIPADTEFTVEIRYAGNPKPVRSQHWGGLGWEPLTEGAIVASQPIGAPSWFPCDDRPDAKASYNISVTTGSKYAVLANGRLVSRYRGASTTTWVFDAPEPMATYLATVQIGHYALLDFPSDGGVRQRAAVPPAAIPLFNKDFGRQPRIMATFERLFGPYPFAEYAIVVTGDELEIPVEAQGLSIFGLNHLDGRRGSERLVAHELAHQWFGNSLTVADWRHIWLNEGFANYSEWLWSQESGGDSADVQAARCWRRVAAMPQDLILADPGVARIFDDRVYQRGALTVHALRRAIGDEAFFVLLRDWTAKFQHGTVRTEDFTALAGQHAGRPLDELFDRWLFRPALPPATELSPRH